MKKIIFAAILLGLSSAVSAQNSIFKQKTKVEVKNNASQQDTVVNVKNNVVVITNKKAKTQTQKEKPQTQNTTLQYQNAKPKTQKAETKKAEPKKTETTALTSLDKTRFALKLHLDIGMGDVYKVIGSNIDNQSSSALNLGLDFGYKFYSNDWFNLWAFTGFGIEKSSIEIAQSNLSYQYETDQDVDGDTYIRKYSDVNVSQKVNLTNLNVPVYAEIEYPIINKLYAYADLGILATFSGKSTVSSLAGTYKVSGLYSQYSDIEFGESSGINGFTNNGVFSNNKNASYNTERSNNSVKLLCQLGVRYNVWDNFYLDVCGGYLHSFKKTTSSEIGDLNNYPLLYNLQDGETFNAFASQSKHLINKFSVNVGIMYKF